MSTAFWVWLIAIIALIILEAATTQLVAIWFIAGALAALLLSIFSDSVVWQILVFAGVSLVTLFLLRPLAKRRMQTPVVPTNADMVIGKTAVVLETIDNVAAKGRVQVSGLDWSARSRDNIIIEKGSRVGVCAIEGVKLIVVPAKED